MSSSTPNPRTAGLADWLLESNKSLPELAYLHAQLILDTVEDDQRIIDLAKQVLDPKWVDGDSYGVPAMFDIVERLVNEIKTLRS